MPDSMVGQIIFRVAYPRDFIDIFFEDGRYMRHDFYNIIINPETGKITVFKRDKENLYEEVYDFAEVKMMYRHTQGRLLSGGVWRREDVMVEEPEEEVAA